MRGGSPARATNISVPIERGGTRELSLVFGRYVSLFETRGGSVHPIAGCQTVRQEVGTLHSYTATSPLLWPTLTAVLVNAAPRATPQPKPCVALNLVAAA